MDQVTQQNAALVEEAAAAAASLQEQAARLRDAVGAFRIGEAGAAARKAAVRTDEPVRAAETVAETAVA